MPTEEETKGVINLIFNFQFSIMSRYLGPKARLCRREGINLFGRPKYERILEKRPSRPGMAGSNPKKNSAYALQLREKQKLRFMFGLTEKQFSRYVAQATQMKGLTPENLMRQLEMRLDNVLYRAGLALTRTQARQMSTHGHFLINEKRVDVPSYQVKVGDKIELRPRLKNSKLYPAVLEENINYKPARWMEVSTKNMSLEITGQPTGDDFEKIVDTAKIFEYYSR
jgi:small subunit ribosomal protein S4